MQLREVSFDKLNDDIMPVLSEALIMYNNLFEQSKPHLNHMKQSLEIAKSLGIDTQKKERSDESRLCFEAAVVLVLANRPEGQAVQYHCLNRLLRDYPEFVETEEIEQTKLLHFRNLMAVSLQIIPANHNRAHLLNLITRLTEGRCVKYVTGSGAMRSTRRRVLIYEREGRIVPTIRPPRKDSKPPRKPPRRKRKRELPPGCTSFIVTNTYNEHSLRLKDTGTELDQSPDVEQTEDLPMFIRIPSTTSPVSAMKVPTSLTISPQDMALETEFHGFVRAVWEVGIKSACYGWTGTFLETVTTINTEEVEHSNRARTAYMKVLELYYHINEGTLLLEGQSPGRKLKKAEDPYLQQCLDELVVMFEETTSSLSETHHEHIKILGLFFCLQRCTKRGLFQYFGEVSMRAGSDICLDFIQAVEVYFTMLFRLSCYAPDSKSGPVMLIALQNSYARVMEIYIRVKCGVASGLLHLHQSSWSLARESLYTEFYLMRQHALGLAPRKAGEPEWTRHEVVRENRMFEGGGASAGGVGAGVGMVSVVGDVADVAATDQECT
jgi:hypothetical protein